MSMIRLPLVKKSFSRLRWTTVVSSMLVALLASHVVTASGERERIERDTSAQALGPQHDFLQIPKGAWLSHSRVSKRAYATTAHHVDKDTAERGTYFRTLTRIYGASTDHHVPAQIEPMPQDEVATFHQMETHMPVATARVTSEFGHRPNPLGKGHVFHRGIDLAAPVGTPVYAVAAGTIVKAARDRSYGNVVVINHHNGYKTLYAHNSKLQVKLGEKVKAGQLIAKVGSTGHSTGPHLHFEIHRSGQRVDPGPYLAAL
jgi:murein DD-endopeptidase MepM/ murein hydrolase activator NlpD